MPSFSLCQLLLFALYNFVLASQIGYFLMGHCCLVLDSSCIMFFPLTILIQTILFSLSPYQVCCHIQAVSVVLVMRWPRTLCVCVLVCHIHFLHIAAQQNPAQPATGVGNQETQSDGTEHSQQAQQVSSQAGTATDQQIAQEPLEAEGTYYIGQCLLCSAYIQCRCYAAMVNATQCAIILVYFVSMSALLLSANQ